jgi:hypothetical protein
MGFVFAGEAYGGSGGRGYVTAYAPSRTLNANIVAADTSAKIPIFKVKTVVLSNNFTHTYDTEPPVRPI